MSIAKPFTFTANTYAKASEVNADFDVVYSQVNTNISAIAQNATDIDNLENNKADINGSTSQRFAVADAISNGDAINKQTLFKAIGNSLDYISGLVITKDSGSPNDTIIVSEGSCYDSTKAIVLSLGSSISKQNLNQGANTTYYVYIIGNSTGSLIDILISTSSITPGLPTGYSLFRQIGSYTTNSNGNIDMIISGSNSVSVGSVANGSMVPNWSAKVGRSLDTTYTADSNGYIIFNCTPRGDRGLWGNLIINGETVQNQSWDNGVYTVLFNATLAKGDTYLIQCSHPVVHYYFIPAKGV